MPPELYYKTLSILPWTCPMAKWVLSNKDQKIGLSNDFEKNGTLFGPDINGLPQGAPKFHLECQRGREKTIPTW